MRYLSLVILLWFSAAQGQEKAVVLARAGGTQFITGYVQIAAANANGTKNATTNFKHGVGEVRGIANQTDTTNPLGTPKLKSAGTGPPSWLASNQFPSYSIPGTTTSISSNSIALQVPQGMVWELWMDSVAYEYMKTIPNVDTNRFYLVGLSLGANGVMQIIGDSLRCSKYACITICCPNASPATLNAATYAAANRRIPPLFIFTSATDIYNNQVYSRAIVTALNNAFSIGTLKGPLNTITYVEPTGATAGTDGHQIWGVFLAFIPTNLVVQTTLGGTWVFNMSVYQRMLSYTLAVKARPPGY